MNGFVVFLGLALAGQTVEVHWEPGIAADAVRGGYDSWLKDHAERAARDTSRLLSIPLERTLRVTVHSAAGYREKFGSGMSEFAWAHYFRGGVHINGGLPIRPDFVGLLFHEMTHAVLDSTGRSRMLPRWLNEGLAELSQSRAMGRNGIDDVQRIYLKDALRDDELPALSRMGRPRSATQYLQCEAAVNFAFDTFGRKTVMRAVHGALKNGRFDRAWESETQTTVDRFDERYRAWIAKFRG